MRDTTPSTLEDLQHVRQRLANRRKHLQDMWNNHADPSDLQELLEEVDALAALVQTIAEKLWSEKAAGEQRAERPPGSDGLTTG